MGFVMPTRAADTTVRELWRAGADACGGVRVGRVRGVA